MRYPSVLAAQCRAIEATWHGQNRLVGQDDGPMPTDYEPWYCVRCVFAFEGPGPIRYEERITLWHAETFDDAIAAAEAEAADYAELLDGEYVGLAQAFHLAVEDRAVGNGDEVFSLMRESTMDPEEYITRYFATGTELQGQTE